jgi:hypothetical protein
MHSRHTLLPRLLALHPPPTPPPHPPPCTPHLWFQAQMLSSWFRSPGVCGVLSLCKLWLFNNALGDDAAPALATLIAAR